MKIIRSKPHNTEFHDVYAPAVQGLSRAGWAAQIVSAATEIGGIYAAAWGALHPILPALAPYIAAVVAVLATAVIEAGLRGLLPVAVDAVLWRRWQGMHRAMSVAALTVCACLLFASGWLSFTNSKVIVQEVAAPPAIAADTSGAAHAAAIAAATAAWGADSLHIEKTFAPRIAAAHAAAAAALSAAAARVSQVQAKERTTGQPHTTALSAARVAEADTRAEHAARVASIETDRAGTLSDARSAHSERVRRIDAEHAAARAEHAEHAAGTLSAHAARVRAYGGGLAWFTVAALLIFLASVVVARIHRKGAGIDEAVELAQYDLLRPWWADAAAAVAARMETAIRHRIAAYEYDTAPPPPPAPSSEMYCPREAMRPAWVTFIGGDEAGQEVYRPVRRIGFHAHGPDGDAGTDASTATDATTATDASTTGTHGCKCEHCGNAYTRNVSWQRFCSETCRLSHHAERHGGRRYNPAYTREK